MSYGREDVVETRTPAVSRVREPEPPRDYLWENFLIIERDPDTYIWCPGEPLTPVATREHLLALWNAVSPEMRDILSLRVKGTL